MAQAGVGFLIDKTFLPRGEDNNIAPRLITRLFQRRGKKPRKERDWTLGTLFHESYGAGWGALIALAADRLHVSPLLVAPAAALLIYASAFSRFGVGTLTGTERKPDQRNRGKARSLVAVASAFPLFTAALLEGWDRRRGGA